MPIDLSVLGAGAWGRETRPKLQTGFHLNYCVFSALLQNQSLGLWLMTCFPIVTEYVVFYIM